MRKDPDWCRATELSAAARAPPRRPARARCVRAGIGPARPRRAALRKRGSTQPAPARARRGPRRRAQAPHGDRDGCRKRRFRAVWARRLRGASHVAESDTSTSGRVAASGEEETVVRAEDSNDGLAAGLLPPKRVDLDEIEQAVTRLLGALGQDDKVEVMANTPRRVAELYAE